MEARKTSPQSLSSIAGAILLTLGFVIFFSNLDGVFSAVSDFAGISAHEGLGVLPAVGLAGLRALRTYTFNPGGFVSALLQILVSFWPLVLIFVGVVVWLRAIGHQTTTFTVPARTSQSETSDGQ